ncbi:histidine--tRNA ligase [Microvirga terrestris]|uniref:Histidine--tRNA ligase n=1 Tax=Microvirga terrestris TaxID=2791024 RepID=A0ABS0HQ78_9HYPH|nr:histidine--tRNA ligase [Microvirga terrestris]MBF9195641.1 histidine--tRNA ligase [Microvirga terrestris]
MSKADKIKARAPRGFADRNPADLAATERMLAAIRESYELYGFEGVETPFVEYTDSLGKFLPDQDRPNEGVFSFQDDDEQWLSLRYDLTAPLARYVAENFDALPKPYRSYRSGWVFRNEKPGPGRFRQFMQFDADTVGAASVAADAEICMMAADTMERLGLRGQYVIKVNNRKILDGLMEAIDLGGDDKAAQRLIVLRALDKFDRLGEAGVRALLGEKRVDESGDVTQGAGLLDWQIDRLIWFVTLRSGTGAGALVPETRNNFNPLLEISGHQEPMDMLSAMDAAYGSESQSLKGSQTFSSGIQELKEIGNILASAGYDTKVMMDPSVVRGLEYYTGPVYEAELTFQVQDEDGRPVRFGSVGGGGRYDGLVGRFRSEPVPATGFSIGVSRLLSALQMVKSPIVSGSEKPGPVVVLVMDKDQIAAYQRMVSALRQAGIRAELYLGSSGMKAQMKYADKRQSPCVIIQGSNERERGEVEIKDLIEGAKAAQAIASNEEWKAARPAQFSVAEAKLVEAVREVLARHFPSHFG